MLSGETPAVVEQKKGKTPAVPDMIRTLLETRKCHVEERCVCMGGFSLRRKRDTERACVSKFHLLILIVKSLNHLF